MTPGRTGTFATNSTSGQGSNTVAAVAAVTAVRRKFRVSDLPFAKDSDEIPKWNAIMVPLWIDYVLTMSENPWDFGDLVSAAQALWNTTFRVEHELAARGEPVYFLVSKGIYCCRNFN